MRIKCLMIGIIMLWVANAYSHDFVQEYMSQRIYYNILPDEPNAVEVTRNSKQPIYYGWYTGDLVIPEEVEYSGNKYKVIKVGDNAIMWCDSLKSVTLPSSITCIGLNNFLGCRNLLNIKIDSCSKLKMEQISALKETQFYKNIEEKIKNQKQISSENDFDEIQSFKDDVTYVCKNGLWGVIDRIGHIYLPCIYEDKFQIRITYDKKYKYSAYVFIVKKNNRWGVVDINNNILCDFIYSDAYSASSQYDKIEKKIQKSIGKGDFYSKECEINGAVLLSISAIFNHYGAFCVDAQKENNQWGIIRKDNREWKTIPQFDSCKKISGSDRFLVSKKSKFGLIDSDGKTIIFDCIYDLTTIKNDLYLFSDGKKIMVMLKDGHYLVSDLKTREPAFFDNIKFIAQTDKFRIYAMLSDDKWRLHVIDDNQNAIVAGEYDYVTANNDNMELHKDDYKTIISSDGSILESVAQDLFEEASQMSSSDINAQISKYKEVIANDFFSQGYAGKAYNNIGVILQNAGNNADALSFYQKAMNIDPNVPLYKKNYDVLRSYMKSERLKAILGVVGDIANITTTLSNGSSKSNNGNYSNSSTSSSVPQTHRVCSLCHGTGRINDDSTPTFGQGGTKWCPECHAEVPASHCHGCKICPSCRGKGYN